MFKIITQNFGAKLFSILFAISLWIYVVGVADKIDVFPTKIPVQIKNLSSNIALANDLPDLEVKIKAPYVSWQELTADDFSAYIDLANLSVGDYDIEPKITCTDNEVEILEKRPNRLKVKLETISSKNVPVELKIGGQAKEGCIVVDTTTDPSEVWIEGAKSIVEKVFSVHGEINLNGEMGTINRQVDLFALDASGNRIKNLIIKPESTKATILIQESTNAKTVGVKASIIGSVDENYWVSKVVVDPVVISITGDINLIKDINYLETEKINISGAAANLIKTVKIDLPAGVTIIGGRESVLVKIYLQPQISSRLITAGLVYQNGLASTSDSVTVLVSGPINILNNLGPKNLYLEIDIGGKSPGKYNINIESSMVRAPSGVSVIDLSPKSISLEVY